MHTTHAGHTHVRVRAQQGVLEERNDREWWALHAVNIASQVNWETERKQVGKGQFKESVICVNEPSELRTAVPHIPRGTQSLWRPETVSVSPAASALASLNQLSYHSGALILFLTCIKPTVAVLTCYVTIITR